MRSWPYRGPGRASPVLARGAVVALLAAAGCSGPPALSRAILPRHQAEYSAALARDAASPGRAFLAWRASQQSLTLEQAQAKDAALGATRNPFNANRDRDAVSLGAVIYATHCQRCHGENVDGRGPDVLPEHPCKDFHAFDTRFAATLHGGAPRAWFARIRDGHGDVVPYPSGPSTAMPPFGQVLSNEQIWLAITYLQSLDLYVPPAAGQEK